MNIQMIPVPPQGNFEVAHDKVLEATSIMEDLGANLLGLSAVTLGTKITGYNIREEAELAVIQLTEIRDKLADALELLEKELA